MAKTKETQKTEKKEQAKEKYPLLELVLACPEDDLWIIYNLSRAGLLEQYEKEIKEYGIKDITPSLTIDEFNKIIQGH